MPFRKKPKPQDVRTKQLEDLVRSYIDTMEYYDAGFSIRMEDHPHHEDWVKARIILGLPLIPDRGRYWVRLKRYTVIVSQTTNYELHVEAEDSAEAATIAEADFLRGHGTESPEHYQVEQVREDEE